MGDGFDCRGVDTGYCVGYGVMSAGNVDDTFFPIDLDGDEQLRKARKKLISYFCAS